MQVPASSFKAYDIRGVVPTALNAPFARALGRAFGTVAMARGERAVAVGRDGRLSGPELADALMTGLQEAGVAVIDIGRVTTPMLYFAASTLCSSGIQVTDVGLHRSNRTVVLLRARSTKGLGQSCNLDGIAKRRSRPVCFNVGNVFRAHTGQRLRL